MKSISPTLFLLFCFFWIPPKKEFIQIGKREPINLAISDLIARDLKLAENVFFVTEKEYDEEVLIISIYPTLDKLVVITADSVTYSYKAIPTSYIEKDHRLFYWYGDEPSDSYPNEIIKLLEKYSVLDTMIVNVYIPGRVTTGYQDVFYYFFCKNDLDIFKMKKSKMPVGKFSPPRLKCN
ncbi:hypothetical protein [Mariniradius saccharolyticus]|uniref:hypothetical protein n=1 Tax=Mariniradius saccharolyticus TaxID=1245591 RepID=UPI00058C3435|nr:hypothetical protein [Mariniradius saccharolyticus]